MPSRPLELNATTLSHRKKRIKIEAGVSILSPGCFISSALNTQPPLGAEIMLTLEWILFSIMGLAGVLYALKSHDVKFTLTDHLWGFLQNRKALFFIGLAIVFLGFALAYVIREHHGFITLIGSWLMLAGSAPWFNKRIVRRFFDPAEWRVIRTTIYAGLLLTLLSTGFFYFPPLFSPGTFLMGIAITILAGRLWWNQDIEAQNRTMVFSKRDYS